MDRRDRLRARIFGLGMALVLSACTEDRVVGDRCPSPYVPDGGATLARGAGRSDFYGTSCAPCDGDTLRLDAHGCPVYVTFQSCGGDVCIGGVRVREGLPDAGLDGAIDEDGGADDDGGASEEDGGAD